MFNIKQQQSDHHQQSSLPPSTSRLRGHNSKILPTASGSQFDDRRDVSIVIGEGAAQDTPQDPRTTDMASCGMAVCSSPPTTRQYATVPYMYRSADVGFVDIDSLGKYDSPRPLTRSRAAGKRKRRSKFEHDPLLNERPPSKRLNKEPKKTAQKHDDDKDAKRLAEGIPEHQQVIFPVNQGNDQLGHALRREMPVPTRAAVSYPSTYHAPPPDPPTAENLQQLANRYMHHAGSQVDAVCIEKTSAGRYRVTIALEVTDIL